MKLFRLLAISSLVYMAHPPCTAQLAGPFPMPTENITNWMDKIIGPDNTGIIIGNVYMPPAKGYRSDHYLLSEPSAARITFNGYQFDGLLALYDIYQDALVLQHRDKKYTFQYIELDKNKVTAFRLQDRSFRKLKNDFTDRQKISGYFEVLFESPRIWLIEKHAKTQRLQDRLIRYETAHQKYCLIDDQMRTISRGKDLYKMFGEDDRERIREFARTERIRMRSKNTVELTRLVAFCERLLDKQ